MRIKKKVHTKLLTLCVLNDIIILGSGRTTKGDYNNGN